MCKNTPLACERKATWELRGQTRGTGPTHHQKWWPTRSQTVKTRKRNHKRVLTRSAGRWRNHQSKRAKRPHSKISVLARRLRDNGLRCWQRGMRRQFGNQLGRHATHGYSAGPATRVSLNNNGTMTWTNDRTPWPRTLRVTDNQD
jgi:hypothetical protein